MTIGDTGPRVYQDFFEGKDPSKVILVIAGVHGSEQSGIEVVQKLIWMLSHSQPKVSVAVVPVLFAANYGRAQVYLAEQKDKSKIIKTGEMDAVGRWTLLKDGKKYVDPNRQFPEIVSKGAKHVSAHIRYDKGIPKAANKEIIEDENVRLINIIESLPNLIRIISVHGIRPPKDDATKKVIPIITTDMRHKKALAGIFVDPPTSESTAITGSREYIIPDPVNTPYWDHYNKTGDDKLAIETAKRIRTRQDNHYAAFGLTRNLSNDWVVGNWLDEKYPDSIYPSFSTGNENGVSLGGWASREVEDHPTRPAIPVFTCEPRRYYPSSIFLPLFKAGLEHSEREDNKKILNQHIERLAELSAFASLINEVLING